MTKGLLISTRKKNELSKKVKKHPETLQNYYKKYKNNFTALVRAAKNIFYKKQLSKTINDMETYK